MNHSSNTDLNQCLARYFSEPQYNEVVKVILSNMDVTQLSDETIGQAFNNFNIVETLHQEYNVTSFNALYNVAISEVFGRGAYPELYQGQEDPESTKVLSYLEANGLIPTYEVPTLGEA